jgi:hypothetical protein
MEQTLSVLINRKDMMMTTIRIANPDNDNNRGLEDVIQLETADGNDVVVFSLKDKRMLEPITLENFLGSVHVVKATRGRLKRHVPDYLVGKPEIFETFEREIVYAPNVRFFAADLRIL